MNLSINYSNLIISSLVLFNVKAWMPGRRIWGELTSASNCKDYQVGANFCIFEILMSIFVEIFSRSVGYIFNKYIFKQLKEITIN